MDYKIRYSNYGVANRFPNGVIEVHKKLKKQNFLPLFNEIIEHEKGHTDAGWSFYDLKHDVGWIKNKKLWWKFVLTTPSSWVQFLPIYRSRKQIYIDVTLLIFWAVIILLIGGLLFLLL